jgi:hypothetical protein
LVFVKAVVSQSAAIPESKKSRLASPTIKISAGQINPFGVGIIGAEVIAVMTAQTAKKVPRTGRRALRSAAPAARGIRKTNR